MVVRNAEGSLFDAVQPFAIAKSKNLLILICLKDNWEWQTAIPGKLSHNKLKYSHPVDFMEVSCNFKAAGGFGP